MARRRLLLAEIGEADRQVGADLLTQRTGDTDPAGRRQRLQPGSDVDAVAK
jgi:hypothetical protein